MRRAPAEIILVALLLAGCEVNPPASPPSRTLRAALGPSVGDMAPDISGVDIDGIPFKLSDYRGKVVMLDFWGLW
jgi:hypothetical protein